MNIILFGPPGAGKGTQCAHIAQRFGLYKLSTGDLIRQEIKDQTEIGMRVQAIVESGAFPDSSLVNEMVESIVRRLSGKQGIVFDGYPRTLEQGEFLDKLLERLNSKIDCIIMLDVEEDQLIPRILSRVTCSNCGAIYSDGAPPKISGVCDSCGGTDLVHRADDTESVIRTRFETYHRETQGIIQYYDQQGRVVHIDGNQPIETVTRVIDQIIEDKQADILKDVS